MIYALILILGVVTFLCIELFAIHKSISCDITFLKPWTKWGREITGAFNFLETRNSRKDTPDFRVSKSNEISSIVLSEGASYLAHRWSDSFVWLMLEDDKFGVSKLELSKHIPLLRSSFSSFFHSGDTQSLGLVTVRDRLSWGELLSSGIEVLIADTFIISDSKLGICIVGGSSPAVFSTGRILEIKNLCRTLGKELLALQELHELNDAVTRLNKETAFAKEMVKYVSHDLRSPLHTLRLVLSTLPGELKDDEIVTAGLRSCDAAQSVVDSLLDLTKENLDESAIRNEVVLISSLVWEVLPIFKPLAAMKNISLKFELNSLEKGVYADKRLIKRVLTNLISNAIKYTQVGNINVALDAQNNTVLLEVSDSGVGMSPEEIQLLGKDETRFKPELAEGIGVGFAATKKMLEMMNASLKVNSELGFGTKIVITFPEAIHDQVAIGF